MLICTSFAEVGCNWKSIYAAIRTMVSSVTERFQKQPFDADETTREDDFVDPVPADERVPLWMWGSVLILSIIVSCVVMNVQFGQNVGITLLGESGTFLYAGSYLTMLTVTLGQPSCLRSCSVSSGVRARGGRISTLSRPSVCGPFSLSFCQIWCF